MVEKSKKETFVVAVAAPVLSDKIEEVGAEIEATRSQVAFLIANGTLVPKASASKATASKDAASKGASGK